MTARQETEQTEIGAYTVCAVGEAPDVFEGKYPGEMRFLTGPLATEQVALSYRRMPAGTGGKGSYGHRHKTQEEIYVVLSGRLEFKLDDEVVELGPLTAVRVAPHTVRSVWNEGPEEAVLMITSTRIEDVRRDVELVEDFWPAP
jgi:mannose-6-phosphate isomerase-like protein (cupin superfamily)